MKEVHFLTKGMRDTKNRYKLGGKIPKLEEVLPGNLTYPETYGIVLRTWTDNSRALDGFVLSREPPTVGSVLEVRPVGTLKIRKDGITQKKIISVASKDKDLEEIKDIKNFGEERLKKIEKFYKTYAYLNDEDIKVESWSDKDEAEKLVKHSKKVYKKKHE